MTTIPAMQVIIMAGAILSGTVGHESEVQSLTNAVDKLTKSVTFWNNAILWGLAATFIAAGWIVVTQRLALIRSKELTNAQSQLDLAKDFQLRADLSAKEAQIRQLGIDLANANSQTEEREEELAKEQRKTADAQADAAKAQLALSQYVDDVAKQAGPRQLDAKVLLDELKGKPKATVALWYKPDDSEAYMFASAIEHYLGPGKTPTGPEGAGWDVSDPQTIPKNLALPKHGTFSIVGSMRVYGSQPRTFGFQVPPGDGPNQPTDIQFKGVGVGGLTVLTRDRADEAITPPGSIDTPLKSLVLALAKSTGLSIMVQSDPNLPPDLIVIVVGQKR